MGTDFFYDFMIKHPELKSHDEVRKSAKNAMRDLIKAFYAEE